MLQIVMTKKLFSFRSMFRNVVANMNEALDISLHLKPLRNHFKVSLEAYLSYHIRQEVQYVFFSKVQHYLTKIRSKFLTAKNLDFGLSLILWPTTSPNHPITLRGSEWDEIVQIYRRTWGSPPCHVQGEHYQRKGLKTYKPKKLQRLINLKILV